MIKEKKVYYTDDSKVFENLEDAQDYEANHFLSITDDDILLYDQNFNKIDTRCDKIEYDSIDGVIIKSEKGQKYFQKFLDEYDVINTSYFKKNELYFWDYDECLWDSVTDYLQYISDKKFNGKLHLHYDIPNN